MNFNLMNLDAMSFFIEFVGWAGAVIILVAYGLLSAGKLEAKSVTYQALNIVGAAGFVINSGSKGAIPSATLNVIWILIGVYALARRKTA